MMKTKCGMMLPNTEEIAEAVRFARRHAFFYAVSSASEMQLAFDCRTGEFLYFATPGEYWKKSCNKPIIRIPYMCAVDARVIAKEFRAKLCSLYSVYVGEGVN